MRTEKPPAEESAAASEELSGQATMMQALISTFKIGENPNPGNVSFADQAPLEDTDFTSGFYNKY
jgi:hypothetical protein